MKTTLTLLLLITLLGCSDGFQTTGSGNGNEGSNSVPVSFDISATIASGPFEGASVLNNVRNSQLEILIPLGINNMVPVGQFENSNLGILGQVTVDGSGFKTIRATVPFAFILQGVNSPAVSQLPTGEAISGFFVGRDSVPATSFSLDPQGQVVAHLYSAPPRFGLFIQTPFDQTNLRSYPVNLANSFVTIGSFSTHPHVAGQNGGMFLFISLPQ